MAGVRRRATGQIVLRCGRASKKLRPRGHDQIRRAKGVMKRTKTTEITLETDEFFLVRRRDRLVHRPCVACGKVVQMVTVPEAISLAGGEFSGEQSEARLFH